MDSAATMQISVDGTDVLVDSSDSVFWDSFKSEMWEPLTFAVMRDVLEPGATYLDIGSWIGPTILLAAAKAGRIQGFEPDPVAFRKLCRNLDLNRAWIGDKVTVQQAAVADRDGELQLVAPGEAGASVSSLILTEGDNRWTVASVDASRIVAEAGLSRRSLIKMDIEGGEYVAIPRMASLLRDIRPSLYLSLHPFNITGGRLKKLIMSHRILRSLRHYRYIYTHLGGGWVRCHRLETYQKLSLPMRLPLGGNYVFTERKLDAA
jgi:FkbM family methyltransferase